MTAYRTLTCHAFVLTAMLGVAAPAFGGEQVFSLSAAEREKLLNAVAERNAGVIEAPTINGVGRRIHGEIGMMIGTNGARGIYSSMVAPIGEKGTIALAFEKVRFGRR